jgi:peptidoglycan/LPS O-acetylase OafA/YrhL
LPREARGDLFLRAFAWGTLTSTMYLPFVLLALNVDSAMARWLSKRSFLRIATLGYGIYLFHIPLCSLFVVPFAALAFRAGVPLGLVWLSSLALLLVLSAALSYVTHVLVEKPALWLRDRFAP